MKMNWSEFRKWGAAAFFFVGGFGAVIPTVLASLNTMPGSPHTATAEGLGWGLFWVAAVVGVIVGALAGLLSD